MSGKSERADRILASHPDLPSRSQLKQWFEEERIFRDREVIFPKTKIAAGDKITIVLPPPKKSHLDARRLPLNILHDDESLIVLYKPRGLSMHPGAAGNEETTLAHALVAYSKDLSKKSGEFRPGIVHRLDKDTEGIVVIAKNDSVHEALSSQFSARQIDRRYWALCWGKPPKEMNLDGAIGRHPRDRKKMAVTAKGKPAKTTIKNLQTFEAGYSWVECKLHTGRTHQIRVHLSHKGFPILNDPVYGRARSFKNHPKLQRALEAFSGQALCAFELGFEHPITKKRMKFTAEKPDWLKALLNEAEEK